ncbi:MAG TPA: 4Fe-4S dicluster domain-containing protein [Bryobacteraceae bacterium]
MGNWHGLRKRVHAACFAVFLALPFLNVIRFDIPRERFYFAGYELWINEFAIIFFTLMFLMFLVVASSLFYGRVYCGYLCPQMIFSEASMTLESQIRRQVIRKLGHWGPKARNRVTKTVFYAALAAGSVVLAFVFMAYFVEPRDLVRRLISLDVHTAGGISGAAISLVTFLDFSLVRVRFCTTVCPYGYLQGLLGDGNTLLVHYRDETHECIECKKCVRVCPMGIDIRKSPFQIECIHCAECIDACDEILARFKKPGLIHYAWGEKGELAAKKGQPWDAKRVVVLLILLLYAGGLATALGMRRVVLVRVAPLRATLYRVDAGGRVYNRFRFSVANRGGKRAAVVFTIVQLPGASLSMEPNPVTLEPGELKQGEFEISVPPGYQAELVSHFTIVTSTVPEQITDNIPMTFLAPSPARGGQEGK